MLIGACARMSAEVTDVIGAAELLLGRTIRVPVTTTTWLLSVDMLPSLLSAGALSPDVNGACAETGKANMAARQEPARSVFIRAIIFPFSYAAVSPFVFEMGSRTAVHVQYAGGTTLQIVGAAGR
jgi:hypothetical protein